MRIPFAMVLVLFTLFVHGQTVNETIKLQLSQPSLLRVNAGDDLNLNASGTAIIGESLSVSGGTPEFSYRWFDEFSSEFYEKTPEVSHTGSYWVTVTDQKNCSATDSLAVFEYGTGLEQGTVHPEEHVVVDGQQRTVLMEIPGVNGPVIISVLSLDGRLVYTYSSLATQNQFSHRVDLNGVESGIYLLSIQYSNRKSVRKINLQ